MKWLSSLVTLLCFGTGAILRAAEGERPADEIEGVVKIDLLPARPGNPRNSEGDFLPLADGRLLFVYTHFTGGAGDAAAAHLAARVSADGGATWSAEDLPVVPNEGTQNVMSVSLLRLSEQEVALFYLLKNSASDCRPLMRLSRDEAKTWSEPIEVVAETEGGYYVLNNDRVLRLDSGRLVAPVAQHQGPGQPKWNAAAIPVCYLSDDAGRSWRRGREASPALNEGKAVTAQEPGVVELSDGRLLMFCRTDASRQYAWHSADGGETWSEPGPMSLVSPLSPATIERIPGSSDLLAAWNDHSEITPDRRGKRTPLRLAISGDDGETWREFKTIENDPHGWYCYTALEFVGGNLLLAYCAGDRRKNNGLADTRITLAPLRGLLAGRGAGGR